MKDSIVENPFAFSCKWYGVDEIYNAINREARFTDIGSLQPVPENVHSREFSEWMAGQYRLAMAKGAELAIREMQTRIDEIEKEHSQGCGNCACQLCYQSAEEQSEECW
jgi:hypothetical protein